MIWKLPGGKFLFQYHQHLNSVNFKSLHKVAKMTTKRPENLAEANIPRFSKD